MTASNETEKPIDVRQGSGGVVVAFQSASLSSDDVVLRENLLELFRQHQGQLLRFLTLRLGSAAEAQEVAQEAYIRLLQRGSVKEGDNLRALLYVTARNVATDCLRRRRFERGGETMPDADLATPERILAGRQQIGQIEKLIADLPVKCRYAFICYKFHDMSYDDIAHRMEITESMVRKYVLRAVAYCAAHLERQEE